jgi:hypothetical protein
MTKYLFTLIFIGASTDIDGLTETIEAKNYLKAFKKINKKYDLSCVSRLECEILSRSV